MKYVDIRDLPPCSFSPQCLRLIDDLDLPPAAPAPTRLAYIEDLQDERHLRQLRSHVPGCPTCSALLIEARRRRTQQRMMLYHYMVANERQVPATSCAIFEAIRHENVEEEANGTRRVDAHLLEQRVSKRASVGQDVVPTSSPISLYTRSPQRHRLFQNMITLATVAAVILAAIGLLNRFTAQPGTTSNRSPQPGQTPNSSSTINNDGWNSVVIGLTMLSAAGMVKSLTFYNYDTSSGQMDTLVSSTQTFAAVTLEGISEDGQGVLYDEISTNQQKTYKLFSPTANIRTIYQTSANQGGNAVWMDTTHVLVQNSGEIKKLNVQTGVSEQTWSLQTGKLTFYRQPFLYFIGAHNLEVDALYRVNLAQARPTPQRITNPSPGTHFLLSVDGTTIFYANRGSSGGQGIYAVGSDGSNLRMLRKGAGIPIGYAADNALMVMDRVQSKFQVIKMGTTPNAPEKVILADAAPRALSLCGFSEFIGVIDACEQNIALAPYGHGLFLNAVYANGLSGLVYDNLDTGVSQFIRSLPTGTSVQLPGWSKISVVPTAAPVLTSQAA